MGPEMGSAFLVVFQVKLTMFVDDQILNSKI